MQHIIVSGIDTSNGTLVDALISTIMQNYPELSSVSISTSSDMLDITLSRGE
jgi:hypothetical protein